MTARHWIWLSVTLLLGAPTLGSEKDEALWSAARRGDAAAVEGLLTQGADVNGKTAYGATALSFASWRGHVAIVQTLLDAGADVNVSDSFYKATPLRFAAAKGHAPVVKLLLNKGAEGAADALKSAANQGTAEVVKAILEAAKLTPDELIAASSAAHAAGHTAVVELLTSAGAPANDLAARHRSSNAWPLIEAPRGHLAKTRPSSHRRLPTGLLFAVRVPAASPKGKTLPPRGISKAKPISAGRHPFPDWAIRARSFGRTKSSLPRPSGKSKRLPSAPANTATWIRSRANQTNPGASIVSTNKQERSSGNEPPTRDCRPSSGTSRAHTPTPRLPRTGDTSSFRLRPKGFTATTWKAL
jgi:hypothetical protein